MIGAVMGTVMLVVMCAAAALVVGVTLGFGFRDALERRICGWCPGSDEE